MKKAFTLMEVNLAILVMAGGILSIVGLYSLGFRENKQSGEDVASALAVVVGRRSTARKRRAGRRSALGEAQTDADGLRLRRLVLRRAARDLGRLDDRRQRHAHRPLGERQLYRDLRSRGRHF